MGRNGHGLRHLKVAQRGRRAGVGAVLPWPLVSLQDSSPGGVFRNGIAQERVRQNSQARITRAILGRRATRDCLGSLIAYDNLRHFRKVLIMSATPKKLRVPDLALMKEVGQRIVMLTAYDAMMARLFDRAGIDLLLVGDSLGNVILGLETTIPVSLEAIIHHTRAVTRGATRALVVADMPFLTYQISAEQALQNAARLFQEGGAAAVKLEGGRSVAETVRKLTAAGLPVMGHVGLTPQHVHQLGGMRQQARNDQAAQELILDALALEEAGVFALVLEAIPDAVAEAVTGRLKIPTIGIGAGPHCDGQVLVSYDVLGLFDGFVPPFVKQYAQLGELMRRAAENYANEVRQGVFPQTSTGRRASVHATAENRAFEELRGKPVPIG